MAWQGYHNFDAHLQSEVASRDPRKPQLFEPLPRAAPIFPGEFLQATCEFNTSARRTVTRAGFKHTDEMCNLYLMVESALPQYQECFSRAPTPSAPGGRRTSEPRMPEAAPVLPLPAIVGQGGQEERLGQISAVALDPLDGSIWLLVRRASVWLQRCSALTR